MLRKPYRRSYLSFCYFSMKVMNPASVIYICLIINCFLFILFRMDLERVNYIWTHRWSKTYQQTIFYNTFVLREPPPYNLTFYKGEIHGLFSPRFVEFIIESDVGQKFLEWCVLSGHSSEHYWNTLNYNLHLKAPGGYFGKFIQHIPEFCQHLQILSTLHHWEQKVVNLTTLLSLAVPYVVVIWQLTVPPVTKKFSK